MRAVEKVVREATAALLGAEVPGKKTRRQLDTLRVPVVEPLNAEEIKALRERSQVSQAVFAAYLNTSESSVQQWERGDKKPGGTSLKLLNLVAKKGLKVLA